MQRETPPTFFEYVDKRTYWPRWSLPRGAPQSTPSTQATPITSLARTQQPFSVVIVNQTSHPVPMQTLLQLVSRNIPRQLSPQQQQSSPSPNQPQSQPQQQQTVVIVISQGGQMANTDDILNRLFMAQQPQTVPTSQSFIDSLEPTTITEDVLAKQHQCTVCMEEFHVDDKAIKLPCLHHFHKDCITPWLSTQHTCPMCRHELPTDELTPTPRTTPVLPALPAPSQIPQQQAITQPALISTITAPTAPLALPAPSTSPVITPTPIPTPTTASSTSTDTPTPTTEDPHSTGSGIKRGFLLPTTEDDHASKKTKVDKVEKVETTSTVKNGEQPASKNVKVEEKRETENRTRRQGGSDFGFKRGFLLR